MSINKIFGKFFNELEFKRFLIEISYILIVLPAFFLLVNRYSYLLIIAVFISVLTGFIFFARRRAISGLHAEPLFIVLLLFIYFILSFFVTGHNLKDFFSYQFLRNDGNFFFCYILFFVFPTISLDYKKTAGYFFKFLFSIFTVFSILGILSYFTGGLGFLSQFEGEWMYFALNNSHNATGSVYAVVCISILAFFLQECRKKVKILYAVLLIVNLAALFLTKSRASYLGFIGAAIIIIWLYFKSVKKFFITIGIFFVCSIPVILATGIYKRIFGIFNIKVGTTVIRFYIWEKAWILFSKSPIFGIGFARFNDAFNIDHGIFDLNGLRGLPGIVALYMGDNFRFDAAHVHNSYLQFLTETGVIGLCLVMLFWLLILIKTIRIYNYSTDVFSNKVFLSSVGSVFVLFILSFFEHYMSATTIMTAVSMLSSIALGLGWQNTHNWEYSRKLNLNSDNDYKKLDIKITI